MEVYLDNASTTRVDGEVVKAMLPFFTEIYGNPSSVHDKGEEVKKAMESAREEIARAINAEKEEIIFVSGATEANNIALKNKKVITTRIEHPSILRVIKNPVFVSVDEDGFVDLEDLRSKVRKNYIVSVAHANHEIGTLQDIKEIGKICGEKRALLHVDASQSFTKEKINVKDTNIGMMTLNSHKIHGPKGIGALYVKEGVKLNKFILGGNQESGFRSGTENVPGIIGFGKAVEIAMNNFKENNNKMLKLRNKLIEGLSLKLNGSKEKRISNNVNVVFDFDSETILNHLNNCKIYVSSGSACTSDEIEPSNVLLAIGLGKKEAINSVRFSLSRFNTEEEIDFVLEKVKDIVSSLEKVDA